ncbi:MAG: hypothetical protein KDD82_17495 [Planctomycetes bacterium]|nr:hypothetical protein [Planctomycetota bacterium]
MNDVDLLRGLNDKRNRLAAALRKLRADFAEALPEYEYKGILSRASSLLEAQEDRIQAFAELDLEHRPHTEAELEDVLDVLLRVAHFPRMVHALGQVLVQERKDSALSKIQRDAGDAAAQLEHICRCWGAANLEER